MRRHRRSRGLLAGVPALALFLLVVLLPSPSDARGGAAVAAPTGPLVSTHCSGSSIASSLSGSLSIVGGPAPLPSVGAQIVWLTYFAELNFTPSGFPSVHSCQLRTASATTDAYGDFAIAASIPSSGCVPGSCSYYAGPFAPATFSVINATPAGYFLTQSLSGSTVGLAFVFALGAVSTTPTSRVTLSVNAPTVVHALPLASNNAPSPATVTFAWRMGGSGWSFLSSTTVANVTIEASPSAMPGTLTVWANGSYNGTPMSANPSTLDLAAAATSVTAGDVTPTQLDAGYDATFTVSGVGAAGYAYNAVITPGLGLPKSMASCTGAIAAGGLLDLTCIVAVLYPSAGSSVPSTVLSNGYSSAAWTFPTLTVAQPLGLSLSPAHLVTYSLSPEPVVLTVPGASGTQPYGTACLWTGDGRVQCVAGPGPSYGFSVEYGRAGEFSGRVTLADSAQANTTVPFSASVFTPPVLASIVASTNELGVTSHATFTSSVSGGALPIAYWWNTTSPGGTVLEGTLSADGSLVLDFSPHISGPTSLNLTLIDALGTLQNESARVLVLNGPAVAIASAVTSNWTTSAGAPLSVAWVAVDPAGEPVGEYNASTWIRIAPANGSALTPYLTLRTEVGGAVLGSNGSFRLNVSDWRDAYLNFSIVVDGAGTFVLSAGSGLPIRDTAGSGRLLLVSPDLGHLNVTRPMVALAGARTNHTLWQVHDRFGDALSGGVLEIDSVFGGVTTKAFPLVLTDPNGSHVWINYSAPGDLAGTVTLVTLAGASVYTIVVPATASASSIPIAWLLAAAGVAVAGAVGYAVVLGRRRPEPGDAPARNVGPVTEADLRRLAEGRAHVLTRADPWIGRTLDELAQGFIGRPPSPEEMTEWVASLVADGSLRTVLGEDGRSRFLGVEPAEPEPLPKVELDEELLTEALDRRASEDDGDRSHPGP